MKKRFQELDALRGIAIFGIVIHHYLMYSYNRPEYSKELITTIDTLHYIVNWFFVLSGYVVYMTLTKINYLPNFIVNRFSRLFPAYWLAVLITSLVVTFSPYYNYIPADSHRVLINLTMLQHWFRVEAIDGSYWTLPLELSFYVIMYFVFLSKLNKHIHLFSAIFLILTLIVNAMAHTSIAFAYTLYYIPVLKAGAFFMAGICFYKLFENKNDNIAKALILLSLIIQLAIGNWVEVLYMAVFYLLLSLFILQKLQWIVNPKILFLARMSFSVFLLHQYIGYEIMNYLEQEWNLFHSLQIIITLTVMFSLSWLLSNFFEYPAMNWLRSKLLRKKEVAL